MKRILIALLLLSLAACGRIRPEAQITFRVVDDSGKPVPEATIGMSTFSHNVPGEGFGKDQSNTITGVTDLNGIVTLKSASLTGEFSYGARPKAGYYGDGRNEYTFTSKSGGKWQPWNPTVEIVFKPIVNPIPMYARKAGNNDNSLEIPALDQPIGYDLERADWVAPYGKGVHPDFLFALSKSPAYVSDLMTPFQAELVLSFSNEGDGIQGHIGSMPYWGSALRAPRIAPENGYSPTLAKKLSRGEKTALVLDSRENQNYIFRVRTVVNEKGETVSALYGKIHGDITCGPVGDTGFLEFTYYLNPTPNDRNLEFDYKRNLFGEVKGSSKVIQP